MNYSRLRVAVRDGSSYARTHRLAYYASNFASVTPLNQMVTLGFYDTPGATIKMVLVPRSSIRQSAFSYLLMLLRQTTRLYFAAPGRCADRLHQLWERRLMSPGNCVDETRAPGHLLRPAGPIREKGNSVHKRGASSRTNAFEPPRRAKYRQGGQPKGRRGDPKV